MPSFKGAPHDTRPENGRRSVTPYATFSVDEIAALPVEEFAERDAHLYLWTTNTHLRDAWRVVEAWGFKFSTLLVWAKPSRGGQSPGFPTYVCLTEFILFCRRGSLKPLTRSETNWWEWPRRGAHSQKPEAFLDLVQSVSPGPYLELFSRRWRLGWSYRWHDFDQVLTPPLMGDQL